jgi:hypothetical protein
MKTSGFTIIAATAIGLAPARLPAQADTLSAADRTTMVQGLETSRQAFLASINGLSEAQWRFKPAPARWSIAEVAEHLAIGEQELGEMIRSGLQPTTPFPADSAARLEAATRALYADRTRRFTAPEGWQPNGRWPTQAELLKAFEAARAANLEYARTTRDPLRARALPHPAFGQLDGVHWMVMLAAHMNRHVQQIEEVKRSEGYPR